MPRDNHVVNGGSNFSIQLEYEILRSHHSNESITPGGYSGLQVTGKIEGLKVSIPGFFGIGKFAKYFCGWLDLSGDLFRYSKESEDSW